MMSIDRFKKNIILLWKKGAFHIFVGSFMSKFVAFFGSIFLVRVLDKTSYGILGYVENIYGYVYMFAGMGLGNALLRYVILGKNKDEKFSYYKYAIINGSSINIIIVFTLASAFSFYPHPSEFQSAKYVLMILLLAIPFQYMYDSNALTYRAMLDNKRFAVTAFFSTTILIISRYFGALLFDVYGVVFAKLIVYSALGIILSLITYQAYFKGAKAQKLSKSKRFTINKYSIQYMITNGIWAIFMLNDIFLLSRITGDPAIVADYKVAYVLPGNLSVISTAIGIFIGPYFVKHEQDYNWVWKNYKKAIIYIVGILLPIVLILLVFSKEFITFLYGNQYDNIVYLMRLLLIAGFANSALRYTSAHILSSMGQIKYNMIVSIVGVLSQIILNLIFIPIYGGAGAAVTSIVVYLLMALALITIIVKKYRINNI